jgi:hypothetical protein
MFVLSSLAFLELQMAEKDPAREQFLYTQMDLKNWINGLNIDEKEGVLDLVTEFSLDNLVDLLQALNQKSAQGKINFLKILLKEKPVVFKNNDKNILIYHKKQPKNKQNFRVKSSSLDLIMILFPNFLNESLEVQQKILANIQKLIIRFGENKVASSIQTIKNALYEKAPTSEKITLVKRFFKEIP